MGDVETAAILRVLSDWQGRHAELHGAMYGICQSSRRLVNLRAVEDAHGRGKHLCSRRISAVELIRSHPTNEMSRQHDARLCLQQATCSTSFVGSVRSQRAAWIMKETELDTMSRILPHPHGSLCTSKIAIVLYLLGCQRCIARYAAFEWLRQYLRIESISCVIC